MNNKYRILIIALQFTVGVLASVIFFRCILFGGNLKMGIVSFLAMILGFANGIKGIRDSIFNT